MGVSFTRQRNLIPGFCKGTADPDHPLIGAEVIKNSENDFHHKMGGNSFNRFTEACWKTASESIFLSLTSEK